MSLSAIFLSNMVHKQRMKEITTESKKNCTEANRLNHGNDYRTVVDLAVACSLLEQNDEAEELFTRAASLMKRISDGVYQYTHWIQNRSEISNDKRIVSDVLPPFRETFRIAVDWKDWHRGHGKMSDFLTKLLRSADLQNTSGDQKKNSQVGMRHLETMEPPCQFIQAGRPNFIRFWGQRRERS